MTRTGYAARRSPPTRLQLRLGDANFTRGAREIDRPRRIPVSGAWLRHAPAVPNPVGDVGFRRPTKNKYWGRPVDAPVHPYVDYEGTPLWRTARKALADGFASGFTVEEVSG